MMNATAIYARVSSVRQKEEETIGSQTAAIMEYARSSGYTVLPEWIFQDEGYSGSVLIRPGLERLRDLVTEGQIDTILIYSPDRLSRKYAYQVLLMEEFSRHGAEVIFLNSPKATTPEEQLLLQFQGMFAEYERAQITERSRRGKRHRAKNGLVNVLSGAPYGYQYIKKNESSNAYYEIIEPEAGVVRQIYNLYTEEFVSIGEIVRRLNAQRISTRRGKSLWERSTVWGILRNPAYKGTACFGKTQRAERKKITRPLRKKGGYSARCSANCERPREEWIEIPVPALISEETFALASDRLKENKRLSSRSTKEPTLLQGILVCSICGYAYYRTSTRTSKRKLYYYRCLGSDDYRYPNGRVCPSKPIRQDYLDEIVWEKILHILEDPDLIRSEIERRFQEMRVSSPTKRRKEALVKEKVRVEKAIDKLLDAYQEDLLPLAGLRQRIPVLKKRRTTLLSELKALEINSIDEEKFRKLTENIEAFLIQMRKSAKSLNVKDKQKILRLIVKVILINIDSITIKHSIPMGDTFLSSEIPSYLLCNGSHDTPLWCPFLRIP